MPNNECGYIIVDKFSFVVKNLTRENAFEPRRTWMSLQ